MPFSRTDLTCVDGGGQRTFNYKTDDANAVAIASGYMDEMYLEFRLGDIVNMLTDHTVAGTGALNTYFVSNLNDGAVPRPAAQVELTASS